MVRSRTWLGITHPRGMTRSSAESALAYHTLGDCLLDRGLLKPAIDAFTGAVITDPHMAEPRISLGSALLAAGRAEEADEVRHVSHAQRRDQAPLDPARRHSRVR